LNWETLRLHTQRFELYVQKQDLVRVSFKKQAQRLKLMQSFRKVSRTCRSSAPLRMLLSHKFVTPAMK